ncbi:hypothetical protein [Polluticoccus soli]|uniref:hypothetical protein n=1 Tax=Polluticoccus soli TaxID=3034150 RepID=UPI0023E22241|nr:hypothetical protein [Flavipsychrobacter sp. JY13-12]
MKYHRDKSVDKRQPTHNRQKGDEAAKYEQAVNEQDVQPEGAKYKGVKHSKSSGKGGQQSDKGKDSQKDTRSRSK